MELSEMKRGVDYIGVGVGAIIVDGSRESRALRQVPQPRLAGQGSTTAAASLVKARDRSTSST